MGQLRGEPRDHRPVVGEVKKDNWASVDVLKSLLVNGETDLAATPSYAAANLFNKGVPVRLVAEFGPPLSLTSASAWTGLDH